MPQSTSVPTVQLTRSSLHSRSQGKLEQMDAGTPLIDSAINAVHSAMSPSSNKKLNRPEERMKDKEQPTTRFFSAKELATIQKLPQLMPSDQIRFMRVLQQISGNHTPQASSASRSGATGIHASSEYPQSLHLNLLREPATSLSKSCNSLSSRTERFICPEQFSRVW